MASAKGRACRRDEAGYERGDLPLDFFPVFGREPTPFFDPGRSGRGSLPILSPRFPFLISVVSRLAVELPVSIESLTRSLRTSQLFPKVVEGRGHLPSALRPAPHPQPQPPRSKRDRMTLPLAYSFKWV